MISVKYASIIAVAAFVSGSFVASPELRVYAANTVFSTDIVDGEVKTTDLANNAVTAGKIKDREVKGADIATDAVGARQIAGVTKLIFENCMMSNEQAAQIVPAGAYRSVDCPLKGLDSDDGVTGTLNEMHTCFVIKEADRRTDMATFFIQNSCVLDAAPGIGSSIALIVFDK